MKRITLEDSIGNWDYYYYNTIEELRAIIARIGNGSLIGHNVTIGDEIQLGTNCSISDNVTIGYRALINANFNIGVDVASNAFLEARN